MKHLFPRRKKGVPRRPTSVPDRRDTGAPALVMHLACAADIASLIDSFGHAVNTLGFPYYAVSRVARSRSASLQRTALELVCSRYPDEWVRHYQRRDYASTDPVHRAAFTHSAPYRWHEIIALSKAERRVLDEAREAGLAGGLSIPVHQPGGSILLINLSGPLRSVNEATNSRLAFLIGTQFHFELQRLTRKPSRRASHFLTPRQRECLTWVARGKTSSEIAAILGISHYTVNYHIEEAMTALNCNCRTAAAVNATVQGLIEP
jgi:LuxR family quorum-sensing system transcriptional regulator CciR